MDKALQTMIDNMPEKTGKSLEECKEVLKAKVFIKHSEAVNFLKSDYMLPMGLLTPLFFCQKKKNTLIKI